MTKWHRTLQDRFYTFPREQQLLMVANELNRALNQLQHIVEYKQALERALELLDLLCTDSRWKHALRELRRAREMIARYYQFPGPTETLQDTLIALHPGSWKMIKVKGQKRG